jgi:hypothetical protein
MKLNMMPKKEPFVAENGEAQHIRFREGIERQNVRICRTFFTTKTVPVG